MERVIEDFMTTENRYTCPYSHHYGHGSPVGCGDENGKGNASTMHTIDDWNGSGIVSYNGNKVYFINGYTVFITHVHKPWAMGEIIKNDLTTQKCYIARVNNHFVIADSLKEVIAEMRIKIVSSNNIKKDIAKAFVLAHPEYEKEYDWDEMVTWHSLDPTSCSDGRRRFTKLSNKKSGDLGTPRELIEFMKKSPSKQIAIEMERIYLNIPD